MESKRVKEILIRQFFSDGTQGLHAECGYVPEIQTELVFDEYGVFKYYRDASMQYPAFIYKNDMPIVLQFATKEEFRVFKDRENILKHNVDFTVRSAKFQLKVADWNMTNDEKGFESESQKADLQKKGIVLPNQ